MRHIENRGIVRTVYSGIFRHIQGHWAILPYSGTLRDIKTYSGIFSHYWGILSHIQKYLELNVTLGFATVPYSELETSSKACRTCKMTRHIQSPGITRTLCNHFQGYSVIFRDIDVYYSSTLIGVQLEGGASPAVFWKSKKKALVVSVFGFKFHIQNVFV